MAPRPRLGPTRSPGTTPPSPNEVAALEHELQVIERPQYVAQQARGYRPRHRKEIPFTLDPSVPTPGPDAPGSASTRVGADTEHVTPLESWLSLLFGPAD